MKNFVAGLVLGILAVFLGVYMYFSTGMAPIAASAPPMPFERTIAHQVLRAHLQKEMPKDTPMTADEANISLGAQIYLQHCAVCHGIPGKPQSAIASGMFPVPPPLLVGKGVTDDKPGETYWKVKNGIRMTGMPGFAQTLSEQQMWQVALFLANANKLSPTVQQLLQGPAPPAPAEPVVKP